MQANFCHRVRRAPQRHLQRRATCVSVHVHICPTTRAKAEAPAPGPGLGSHCGQKSTQRPMHSRLRTSSRPVVCTWKGGQRVARGESATSHRPCSPRRGGLHLAGCRRVRRPVQVCPWPTRVSADTQAGLSRMAVAHWVLLWQRRRVRNYIPHAQRHRPGSKIFTYLLIAFMQRSDSAQSQRAEWQ